MYTDIKQILRILKSELFSGHVKIGCEHNSVVSITKETILENKVFNLKNKDFDNQLKIFCNNNEFGKIEFDIDNGNIINLSYSVSQTGEVLRNWMRDNRCKYVVCVEKK